MAAEHLEHLDQFFAVLATNGLTINLIKCTFMDGWPLHLQSAVHMQYRPVMYKWSYCEGCVVSRVAPPWFELKISR